MFGQLISDLKGIADTLTNLFGGGKSQKKYPEKIGGTSIAKITNQPDYKSGAWKNSLGYQFSVVKVEKQNIKGSADGWLPFLLQINPQELSQDEVFAIQVTPTFRGVLVEHQGVTIKDITISGTTGLSPNRREGGALSDDGTPVFQTGTSGFEEFHELRSYFRAYVEMKRTEDKSLKFENRLMFSNFKDNEFLFVEPQKFSMKRNASKPFLYDYTIVLKAIGVASPKKEPEETSIFDLIDNVLSKVDEYSSLAVQVLNASSGILSRFQRNVSSKVINPLSNINAAAAAIRGGAAQNFGQFGITRRSVKALKDEIEGIEANFNDLMGKKSDDFNKAKGRKTTLESPSGRQPTYNELQIANALQAGKKACVILTSKLELFEADVFTTNSQVLNLYPNANITNPNSVSTSTIGGGDNIQTIALRELGDVDRFKEIIILNNLKPPYIDEAGGPGVLKPGQRILIPSGRPSDETSVVKSQRYEITKNMQQAEIDLGVDLRLNGDADLVFTNTKDLDLIAGVENIIQAVGIKMFLEKGGLKRHPQVGTNLQIGVKARAGGLVEIRRDLINSFLTDARIEAVPFVELRQEGGTINVLMVLKIKEIEQPVPLPLTLNVN